MRNRGRVGQLQWGEGVGKAGPCPGALMSGIQGLVSVTPGLSLSSWEGVSATAAVGRAQCTLPGAWGVGGGGLGPHDTPMNRPQCPGAVQALASHPVSGTEPRPHHLPSLLRTRIDLGLGGVTLRAGCAPGSNWPGSSSPLPPTLLTVLQSPRPHSVLEPELTPPPPPEGDSSPGCTC